MRDATETSQRRLDSEGNTLYLSAISRKRCLGEYIYYDITASAAQAPSSKPKRSFTADVVYILQAPH